MPDAWPPTEGGARGLLAERPPAWTPTLPPSAFARHITQVWGDEGAAWLRQLPVLIAEVAAHWSLTVGSPFDNLSYNYVAPAVRADGTPCVLKLGVPRDELVTEIEALRLFVGRGAVKLLEADVERGVMLLERLMPGVPLSQLGDDEQATAAAAEVIRQVWRTPPPGHLFPHVADWLRGFSRLRRHFDGGTGPLDTRLVEQAEALAAGLLASTETEVVLHGDLHHDNILSAERQPWLVIDPKGIVGDPVYEVGALLRNPLPQIYSYPDPVRLTRRRVDLLADLLGFDRQRIIGWGLAQAVLSAWWSIEDEGYGWEGAIRVAAWLAALK
ncbi:MAG: phosphotransferase [Anaerolineae bacterium]|nr:phosphotransferase [Anaerolineae bacterium]